MTGEALHDIERWLTIVPLVDGIKGASRLARLWQVIDTVATFTEIQYTQNLPPIAPPVRNLRFMPAATQRHRVPSSGLQTRLRVLSRCAGVRPLSSVPATDIGSCGAYSGDDPCVWHASEARLQVIALCRGTIRSSCKQRTTTGRSFFACSSTSPSSHPRLAA